MKLDKIMETAKSAITRGALGLTLAGGGLNDAVAEETHEDRKEKIEFINNSGVNYAWSRSLNGSYDHYSWDVGVHPWWSEGHEGFSSANNSLVPDFEHLRNKGVNLARVFLFGDLRTGVEYDAEGKITGPDKYAFQDIQKLLDTADENGIDLIPVLLDYKIADGVQYEGNKLVGEHVDIVTDPGKREAFLENIVRPFAKQFGNHTSIKYLESMNEPGEAHGVTDALIRYFNEEIIRVFKEEAPNKPATMGVYNTDRLEALGNDSTDVTQVHMYPTRTLNANTPASNISTNPVLIGEINSSDIANVMETAFENGYIGVLPWSVNKPYSDGTSFSDIEDEFQKVVERIYAEAHEDLEVTSFGHDWWGDTMYVQGTFSDVTYLIEKCTNLAENIWTPHEKFEGYDVVTTLTTRTDGNPGYFRITASPSRDYSDIPDARSTSRITRPTPWVEMEQPYVTISNGVTTLNADYTIFGVEKDIELDKSLLGDRGVWPFDNHYSWGIDAGSVTPTNGNGEAVFNGREYVTASVQGNLSVIIPESGNNNFDVGILVVGSDGRRGISNVYNIKPEDFQVIE